MEVEMPIFDGEAPETDSEESTSISFNYDNLVVDVSDKVECLEITGEDAESDDGEKCLDDQRIISQNIAENDSLSRSNSKTLIHTSEPNETKITNANQSLLHFKLRESNSLFYNDLESLLKEFMKENEKSLAEIDQYISKSQISLQSASPTLKNLQAQSGSLQNKLQTLLTSNFLSNVKILK